MARAGTSLTADAIRIEDEVWNEAFQTRVPSRRRRIIDQDVTHDIIDKGVTRRDVRGDTVRRDGLRRDSVRQDGARDGVRRDAPRGGSPRALAPVSDARTDSSWISDSSLSGELSDWLAPSPSSATTDFAQPEPATATPVGAATPVRAATPRASEPTTSTRRTVRIQGRGAERNLPWTAQTTRRRPSRAMHERAGFHPDRLAMWAVFLGLLLVLVAVLSGHG